MKLLHQIRIRLLLPLLLGGFSIFVSGLSYFGTLPDVRAIVERGAIDHLRTQLTGDQGTIELLWRLGNLQAIRRIVAAYGAERGELRSLLVADDGTVIASTSLAEIGRSIRATEPVLTFDSDPIAHPDLQIRFSENRSVIAGSVRICAPTDSSLARPRCGFLYHETSLRDRFEVTQRDLQSQTLRNVVAIVVITLLLLALTHQIFTRRVRQLIESVRAFASGETHVRTRLQGADEFAEISRAFDSMLDTVVDEQIERHRAEQALRDSHEALEQRVATRTAELAEALDKLNLAKEKSEQAAAEKSRFLAATSHDLRQPLQSLNLYLSVQRRGLTEPAQLEVADKMQRSIAAMTDMLDLLLDVSRLSSGAVRPALQAAALEPIIERIVSENLPGASRKGLELVVDCRCEAVHSDPSLLARLIENFVTNAIRYTEVGRVSVSCRQEAQKVRIAVADTGIGIAPEYLDKIYDEYFQLDNSARDRGKGLGLGLAIVKRIAELLDYSLEIESTPGEGSVFAVWVPLADTAALARNAAQPSRTDAAATTELVVLLVDDDPNIVDALSMVLTADGMQVHTAQNLQQALACIDSGVAPDVLVSDYRLPDCNGIELIWQVRLRGFENLPAVIITGDASVDDDEMNELGQCLVLHKPVDPDRLIGLMHKLVV